MKKAEFLDLVAKNGNYNKTESAKALDSILDSISEVLSKGDTINFIGFGAFSTSIRAPRKAKVPGTQTVVDVPETTVVKFKSGKTLKENVNKK